ncbi:MAG: transglycosylase SLT domain-containing protein [Sulfuricurvum sp.]|uniref:lytic transglycosylase domain-containing protein n=1 Tax=Sulfuricurvum sp. TaxID=2025608 RepID=UPI0025FC8957|nr:lytic transglycosylase domain-containing protein [Sulfuricurvum sp.]MCK9372889.1 transglycosylase SLT domain-containing protein [Sulfuricurvum sp.]
MTKTLLFLFIPLMLCAIGFDPNDRQKIEVLRHFDIPPSFLRDPSLHDLYTQKKRECLLNGFADSEENADMFIPMLSSLIAQSDLPSEFLFIALTESRLRVCSTSSHGAAGLWQFMAKTGKLQGLEIDQFVDERRDHIKSTRAAITYLSSLKKEFGKWYLALIAYNCGDGRLKKAIRKAGTTDLAVLVDPKRSYLPLQSKNYIRKVVALALLASDEVFLSDIQYDTLLDKEHENPIATVYLPEGEEIDRIAAVLEMPKTSLVKLNTHLKKGVTPPNQDSYPIYIPKEKLEDFRLKYHTHELKGYFLLHRVKSGETLSHLSKRYNVPQSSIIQENKIESDGQPLSNRSLKIPINKPFLKSTRLHTVKSGETLASVASLYNLALEQIKAKNPRLSGSLKEGEELKVGD